MSEQDFEVAQLQAENNRLRAEAKRLKLVIDGQADLVIAGQKASANQREHDLLRPMRLYLLQEDLIAREEYAALASEQECVQRLEDYDQMRARADENFASYERVKAAGDVLRAERDAARDGQRCSEAAAKGWRAEVAKLHARIEASEGALREARTLVAQPSLIESPRVLALIDALLPAPRKEFCESHLCVHGNKPIDCDLCVNTLRGEDADGGEEGK